MILAIRYPITLSTTEPNNDIGLLKIRQADEETQTLVVDITANGQPKSYEGLQPFFCAKLGQSLGLGIIEQKLDPAEMTNPKVGQLEYTFRNEDWQQIGRQVGYFSFRKMKDDGHEYVEQFTTRDFYFNVTKNVFSEGIKEIHTNGSTYIWTIEDLLRLFNEYIASGKSDWEQFVDDNREILESVDPGGEILTELIDSRTSEDFGSFDSLSDRLKNQDETIKKLIGNDNDIIKNMHYFAVGFNAHGFLNMSIAYLDDELDVFRMIDTNGINADPERGIRDPSVIFKDGYFWIAYTVGYARSVSLERIPCIRTKDFITFENADIPYSPSANYFAPQWFVDGNDYYMILTGNDGQYLAKLSDDLSAFVSIEKFKILSTTSRYLDGALLKENGLYYLVVKVENSTIAGERAGDLHIFTCDTINGTYDNKLVIKLSVPVEGPLFVKTDKKYYIFADAFKNNYPVRIESSDLVNWTNEIIVGNDSSTRMQHYDILKSSEEIKSAVGSVARTFLIQKQGYRCFNKKYDLLRNHIKDNRLILPAYDGSLTLALVAGDHLTIEHIERSDPASYESFSIEMSLANNADASLTFVHNTDELESYRNVKCPGGRNLTIRPTFNSDKQFTVYHNAGDKSDAGGWDTAPYWHFKNIEPLKYSEGQWTPIGLLKGQGQVLVKSTRYETYRDIEFKGYVKGIAGDNLNGPISDALPETWRKGEFIPLPIIPKNDWDKTDIWIIDEAGRVACYGAHNLVAEREYHFYTQYKIWDSDK